MLVAWCAANRIMKVFLGANDRQQLCESQSWNDLLISHSFRDLEKWIASKEKMWGQAYIFIETVMPRGDQPTSHNNQFDLLICFSARIVICEMKRHSNIFTLRLKDAISQVNGQINWMRNLLQSNGYDDTGICPVIFFPFLDLSQLATVRQRIRDLHSSWHIWAVGIHSDLKGRRDDDLRPYNMCEALEQRLVGCASELVSTKAHLSVFIQERMTRAGAKLLEFTSFATANAYLRSIAPARQRFIWDTWHVGGLFADAVNYARQGLQAQGIIEIIGPPGSGKSTLIQEVIETLDEDWVELSVRNTTSRFEIALLVYTSMRGEPPIKRRESEILQLLAEDFTLLWIREYDQASAPALLEFFDAIRTIPTARTRWIIESTNGLPAKNHHQWKHLPLGNLAISRIIEKIQSGGYFNDPEQVLELAQGNPRRAIRLWRSCNEDDAKFPDETAWFQRHLSNDERQMLPIVCHAVSNSPLGITLGLLRYWATAIFPDRSSTHCDAVIRSLLEKLESQQLARVSRLNQKTFGGILDAIQPANLDLITVDHLAPGVLAATSLKTVVDRLGPDYDTLHQSLLESGDADSLGFVVSALLQGDLEPFFRSSFRSTMLPMVAEWLDRTNRLPTDARQIYILRALRVLSQVGHRSDLSAERDLGLPASGDLLQRYVFDVARARIAAYANVPDDFNFERGIADAHRETDADLRCERIVSLARSLQHSGRYEESWRVLQDAPKSCPPNSTSFFLAHYRMLEFLNRRKQRVGIVSDADARRLIVASASEVIRCAARVENLQAICDALFYAVRSQELEYTAPSDEDIRGYGAALEFVERNRRRRARRLQILLTHGSLHRHVCRRQDIEWDIFHRHLDTAFIWYCRAFKSAAVQNHLQHKLNALCYMADLCMKAMRFTCAGAPATTIERSSEVLQMVRSDKSVTHTVLSREEQPLLRALNETIPFLLYAEALALKDCLSGHDAVLQKSWFDLGTEIKDRLRQSQYPDRVKYCSSLWKRIERLFKIGVTYNPSRNDSVFDAIRPPVASILELTKPRGGPNLRAWEQLCFLLKIHLRN